MNIERPGYPAGIRNNWARRMPSAPEASGTGEKRPLTPDEVEGRLRRLYDSLDVAALGGRADIERYALSAGRGLHVVVTPDFISGMASGEDCYDEGFDLIRESVGRLADTMRALAARGQNALGGGVVVSKDGVSMWIAAENEEEKEENPLDALREQWEAFQRQREQLERAAKRQKNRFVYKGATKGGATRLLMMLQRAATPSAARDIVISAQQRVYALKVTATLGSSKDSAEALVEIAKMKRVVQRARTKARKLGEESIVRARQQRAEREAAYHEAREYETQLKKQRADRRSKEYAPLSGVYGPLSRPRSEREERERLREMLTSPPLSQEAAQSPAPDGAGDCAGGADVAVTAIDPSAGAQ